MGVLRFTRSGSNRLKWTTLATALANTSDGAWTCCEVVRFATVTAGSFYGQCYLLSGTVDGVTAAGISIDNGGRVYVDLADHSGNNGPTVVTTEAAYMLVTSKATGSAAPIHSRFVKSTGVWTHTTSNDAIVANKPAATMLEIGAWANSDFTDAWVAAVAFWEGEMTQANKVLLATNWRTSDLWTSAHGQPTFLVEGNVAGASVVDLAGNASAMTVSGTSLDAAETLSGWNFNGTGAAAPIPVRRPRRSATAVQRASTWCKRSRGILVPDLWTPSPAGV